jgi:hypothetical protein
MKDKNGKVTKRLITMYNKGGKRGARSAPSQSLDLHKSYWINIHYARTTEENLKHEVKQATPYRACIR